jgi:hypothetical protein
MLVENDLLALKMDVVLGPLEEVDHVPGGLKILT